MSDPGGPSSEPTTTPTTLSPETDPPDPVDDGLTTPFDDNSTGPAYDDTVNGSTLSPSTLLIRGDYELYDVSTGIKKTLDRVFGFILLVLAIYFAINVIKVLVNTVMYWLWSFRRYYEEFKFQFYFGFNEDLYIHDSEEELLINLREEKRWKKTHLEKLEAKAQRLLQKRANDAMRYKADKAKMQKEEKKLLAYLKKRYRDKEEEKKSR